MFLWAYSGAYYQRGENGSGFISYNLFAALRTNSKHLQSDACEYECVRVRRNAI